MVLVVGTAMLLLFLLPLFYFAWVSRRRQAKQALTDALADSARIQPVFIDDLPSANLGIVTRPKQNTKS